MLGKTVEEKATIATEQAFRELVMAANAQGLGMEPVMGLVYLPDQQLTEDFKNVCARVLESLSASHQKFTS